MSKNSTGTIYPMCVCVCVWHDSTNEYHIGFAAVIFEDGSLRSCLTDRRDRCQLFCDSTMIVKNTSVSGRPAEIFALIHLTPDK